MVGTLNKEKDEHHNMVQMIKNLKEQVAKLSKKASRLGYGTKRCSEEALVSKLLCEDYGWLSTRFCD